ncbi:acetate regulatory DNA binding protein FacB [Fusarium fujikuroi]|nr:acetate regulatory DNA binding protein FacB [Fusarium fujikuroi]
MDNNCRQQAGLACEECRRRKSKCDRGRPVCGGCLESGVECVFVEQRPKRGPKKGQLRELKSRIGLGPFICLKPTSSEIEVADIAYSHSHSHSNSTEAASATPLEEMEWTMQFDLSQSAWTEHLEFISDPNLDPNMDPNWQDYTSVSRDVEVAPQQIQTSDDFSTAKDLPSLIQFDLDQLYFDRVHPLFPMVHKRRYLSWTKLKDPYPARQCLRMAMRALAASMSSQFRSRGEDLYLKARQMAEDLEASELGLPWTDTAISIEQTQAWLLLAHYELLAPHIYPVQATARRAFRLVYLSRLHCCDQQEQSTVGSSNSSQASAPARVDFPTLEEKRRTFWVAFCLDRCLIACGESLPAIQDEIISVRLPCPEKNFQNGDEVKMGFADEALKYTKLDATSRFAEFVTSTALFGRCIMQKHLPKSGPSLEKETAFSGKGTTGWHQLQKGKLTYYPTMQRIWMTNQWPSKEMPRQTQEEQLASEAYNESANEAAAKMADVSNLITTSACFKAHPYLPLLLTLAISYLTINLNSGRDPSVCSLTESARTQLSGALESFLEIHSQAKQFVERLTGK